MAVFKFAKRDQGWGTMFRIRLFDGSTDEDVASSPEYSLTPHEDMGMIESFDLNHDLVKHCTEGYRYVAEVMVGGGGGHELH